MQALLQMILPSVALPLCLSTVLWWFNRRHAIALWGLPVIWLPSYVWLSGWPSIIPDQASDWLWLLAVISALILTLSRSRYAMTAVLQTLLLALVLLAIAWPVFQYQFDMMLVVELIAVIAVGYLVFHAVSSGQAASPAMSMAISSGGMALVIALGGSLLIGQLAGALASVLAAFALYEIVSKLQQSATSPSSLIPVMQLYLGILVIARIFAEVPPGPSALLLVAPLAGLLPATRYAFALGAVCVIGSLSWLLLLTAADSSGYY